MQKIIITISITVLLTTLILVSVFIFFQNKEINIQDRVEGVVETQNDDVLKNKITSDQTANVTEDDKGDQNNIKKGEKKAFIVVKGDMNYVVYTDENGGEFIIDEALVSSKKFINAKLSQKKNYVLYSDRAWSHEMIELFKIYDIAKHKNVYKDNQTNYFGVNVNFTPDEKYVYTCGEDNLFGYGEVYLIAESKKIYNVHGKIISEENMEFHNNYRVVSCDYNKDKNVINFELKKKEIIDGQFKTVDEKTVEFELR